jgi:hypothetical protein
MTADDYAVLLHAASVLQAEIRVDEIPRLSTAAALDLLKAYLDRRPGVAELTDGEIAWREQAASLQVRCREDP